MVQCHNCLQSHGVNSNLDLLRRCLQCSSSWVDIGTDDLNIGICKRLKNGIRTELLKLHLTSTSFSFFYTDPELSTASQMGDGIHSDGLQQVNDGGNRRNTKSVLGKSCLSSHGTFYWKACS